MVSERKKVSERRKWVEFFGKTYKIVKPTRNTPKYRVIITDYNGNERVKTAYNFKRAKEMALIHKMASNQIEIARMVAVASKIKKVA